MTNLRERPVNMWKTVKGKKVLSHTLPYGKLSDIISQWEQGTIPSDDPVKYMETELGLEEDSLSGVGILKLSRSLDKVREQVKGEMQDIDSGGPVGIVRKVLQDESVKEVVKESLDMSMTEELSPEVPSAPQSTNGKKLESPLTSEEAITMCKYAALCAFYINGSNAPWAATVMRATGIYSEEQIRNLMESRDSQLEEIRQNQEVQQFRNEKTQIGL